MTLGLDEVGVRMIAASLAAKPPGREDDFAESAFPDGGACHLDGTRVAMIEIDGEEQIARWKEYTLCRHVC